MTNITTSSTNAPAQGLSRKPVQHSDGAPMVITRLSGWIDVTEVKNATPSWIIRTRSGSRLQ